MSYYGVSARSRRNSVLNLGVTLKLVLANVILFIVFEILLLMRVVPIDYIAINPSNIIAGKYLWTFFTSMFMHGGVFHLFVNMLSLVFVGSLVEKILGEKRYFWFYVFSGIVSSFLFVAVGYLFGFDMNAYAVGASGALFGLIGFLMVTTPNLRVYMMFIPIPIKLKYAAPFMLLALWVISIAGNVPIGNIAHLGGLLAGLSYGFFIRGKYPNKTEMIRRRFS